MLVLSKVIASSNPTITLTTPNVISTDQSSVAISGNAVPGNFDIASVKYRVDTVSDDWLPCTVSPSDPDRVNIIRDALFSSGTGEGIGPDSDAQYTLLQSDGKLVVGGYFLTINGVRVSGIARYNTNGTLDTSFNSGTGLDGDGIEGMALLPDDKILIGGYFSTYNGVARDGIARLNVDGSLDTSFNPGSGMDGGAVYSFAVQPDGKILIGGWFTTFNGTGRSNIARLNVDGSLDTSFDPGSGAGGGVYSIVLQPDGKILIGGYFTSYNGVGRNRIARLNADGSLDTSFDPGSGTNNEIYSMTIQSDGKILAGGRFTTYDGVNRSRIARINTDGSLDTSFNPGSGAISTLDFSTSIKALILLPDNKLLISGYFNSYNGTSINMIARLNADGSLDTSFDPGSGASSTIFNIHLRPDYKIVISGYFTSFNGFAREALAQLNPDGTLDVGFNATTGLNGNVNALTTQSDGKVIVGGTFTTYKDVIRRNIARLNADGSLDTSFDPGSGASSTVSSIVLQPDGKMLIGGSFTSYNGVGRNRIARLNADGSLDTSFDPGSGASSTVYSIVLQPDGKILIGGYFTSYNGVGRNRIARLNADGSLDTSFNPGTGTAATVAYMNSINSLALLPDNKLLISGYFNSYNGVNINMIARINSDGSLDTSFNPGSGASSTIYSLLLQPDGKMLIGGAFTSYNGVGRNRIARLNADGTLDTSFDPGSGASNDVRSMTVQSDGKILVGGGFTTYDGVNRGRLARINSDGSLDTSFNPGSGADSYNAYVTHIHYQSDDAIIIGGGFTSYNSQPANYLLRIYEAGEERSFTCTVELSSFSPGTYSIYLLAEDINGGTSGDTTTLVNVNYQTNISDVDSIQTTPATSSHTPTLPPEIQRRLDWGYDANGECVSQKPGGMPEIFRIDVTDTKATLYIAPPSKPYNTFTISYKEVGSVAWGFEHPVYADSPEYAIDFSHVDDGGVVVYTINDLKPNTRYEFKVKCANKCASTSYGNTVAAATHVKGVSATKTYLATSEPAPSASSSLIQTGVPAIYATLMGAFLLSVGIYTSQSTPRHYRKPIYTLNKPRVLRFKKKK